MSTIKIVKKHIKMQPEEAVRFQINLHCIINSIPVSSTDLDCLTLLARDGEQELNSFCNKVYQKELYSSAQSARNAITKMWHRQLVNKEGKTKIRIGVKDSLQLQTEGNIALDIKVLALETA